MLLVILTEGDTFFCYGDKTWSKYEDREDKGITSLEFR
jgi:hypothetical protein